MELSRAIIKEFAKVVTPDTNKKPETLVYGTIVMSDDIPHVKIDGSEIPTPISGTVDAQEGDRVLVSVVNHTATVTGNFTYPPSQRDTIHAQETADDALEKADKARESADAAQEAADALSEEAAEALSAAQTAQARADKAVDDAAAAKTQADTALEKAEDASGEAKTAQMQADKAVSDAANAQKQADQAVADAATADEKADAAKVQADQAVADAKAAQEAANKAQEEVDAVEEDIVVLETGVSNAQAAAGNAQTTADKAVSDAAKAQTAANDAQADADAANAAALAAQSSADSAISKADTAQGTADEAKASAASAQESIKTIKDDVATSQEEIDALATSLETVSNTMEADYARKTDVSETTAHLQSQITQNAAQIQSTVTRITEVDETVGKAAADAQAAADEAQRLAGLAQAQADTATADAAKAQTAADNAKTAADNAQADADEAKQAAVDADAKAAQAAQDLAEAEQNLADVTSRVDSTEEEIEAAQQAVSNAQAAADKANTDAANAASAASAAQSTADQAKTDAANAQTAADNAATNAANAQSTANQAVSDAATAQQTANEAKNAATNAQSTANQAVQDAANAKTAADNAQKAADDADAKLEQAKTDLAAAEQNLADVTSRVDSTEEEIEDAKAKVDLAQKAADDAQADADEAKGIADQAVADAAEAKGIADQAVADALAAQTTANSAASAASTAQSTADEAKTNAATAQTKANEAASAAATAQSTADAAQSKANQAAADLAEAEQNLEDVKSRVDSTEEEIEAAQQAVDEAKAAADAAQADADTAQSTADQAKTDAANAQTAADNAQAAADDAQDAADAAQEAADKAQADADALAIRVTTAETNITQNAELIALAATKTEVATTLGGYYTKTQTDAAITTKANEINLSVSENYLKETSKGEQLVVNGNGMMGDNTNFTSFIFDGAVSNDSPGSFTRALGSGRATLYCNEYFPISTNNTYTFSLDAKSKLGTGTMYSFMMFYDVDKKSIGASQHMYVPGSTTTLAQDLKAGDTVIYLTNASGWSTTSSHAFYLAIWNYTNSFGYTYPAETYTRNRVTLPKTSSNTLDSSYINYTANTITLTTAYSGSTIPAGTSVSQGRDGNTYKYTPLSNTVIPATWTHYSGTMSGVDYSGNNVAGKFPPGVAYGKVGFLWNYNNASGEQQWITNISVYDSSMLKDAKTYADAQIVISKDSILSTVSSTYQTKDAMGNYSTTAQMNSAIEQKADSILSTVSGTYQTKDAMGNYSTTAQMNSAIEQKADSITSSVSSTYATKSALNTTNSNVSKAQSAADAAQADIDNLSVGGRNLVLNSDTIKTAAYGAIINYDLSNYGKNVLPIGQEVIISFDAYATAQTAIDTYIRSSSTNASQIPSSQIITTTKKRFIFKSTMTTTGPVTVGIRHTSSVSGAVSGTTVYISNIKAELGNMATDWSPAPEDMATAAELTTLGNTVASHTTSLNSITSRVSTTETNITTINGNISSITDRVSAAEQKITDDAIISTVSGTYATKAALADTDAKATSAKAFTDNAKNNYGYQYKYTITANGDANLYYPMILRGGNQNVSREIMIFRGYGDKAPAEWNGHTTTKGIGLTLKIVTNYGGWGGASYSWYVKELEELYGHVFAGASTILSGMGFAIMLRGGGTTGATYYIYSDQPLEVEHPTGDSPAFYYNSDELVYSTNTAYKWNAPAPISYTDTVAAAIEAKKFTDDQTAQLNSVIEQKEDSILLQVSQTYATSTAVTSLTTKVGTIEGRVESAEGNISTLTQTATGLTIRLDSGVGGRNLIADTSLDTVYSGNIESNTYKDVWSGYTIDIPTGTEYIVSFEAKADVAQTIRCYFYSPNTTTKSESSTGYTGTGADGQALVDITTEWKRYWVKWKQTAATTVKRIIVGRTFSTDNIYIRAVKLEEGTIPSAWTPAPEDVDSDISAANTAASNAQSTANAASTAASNAQSTANSASTAASNAQSTANAANTAASNAQSTANAASTAASNAQSTANTALSQSIEYIVGTQTTSTNAWTGVTTDSALYVGKTIAYKLPYAGTSTAATLNLTLSGGGTTGAKALRRSNSTVTTQFPAGSVITLTYDGTYWRTTPTNANDNYYDRIRYQKAIKAGTTAIVKANIIVGTGGVYKHLNSGTAFDVTYPILYAGDAISASGTGTNNYLCISLTITTTQSITLTAYKPVYIKGTLSGTSFTPVSTAPLTQTVPTSADGYYYIHLGHAITSTTMYLLPEHPIFTYFDGSFKNVTQIAVEAAKTASNFMSYDATNGLLIGNKTSGSWVGNRAQITSSAFNILDSSGASLASYGATGARIGPTTGVYVDIDSSIGLSIYNSSGSLLSRFADDEIYIGKNSKYTKIYLGDGLGSITGSQHTYSDGVNYAGMNISTPEYLHLNGGDRVEIKSVGDTTSSNYAEIEVRTRAVGVSSTSADKPTIKMEVQCPGVNDYAGELMFNAGDNNATTLDIECTKFESGEVSEYSNLVLTHDTFSVLTRWYDGTDDPMTSVTLSPTFMELKAYDTLASCTLQVFSYGVDISGMTTLKNSLLFSTGTDQSKTKGIKWSTINSKNPYIGYALDQVDGTFVVASILGTNYASGLAIGGGSGNLLYKGNVVLNASNYTSYCAPANHTHNYLPLTGGTLTGALTGTAITTSGVITAGDNIIVPNATSYSGLSKNGYRKSLLFISNSDNIHIGSDSATTDDTTSSHIGNTYINAKNGHVILSNAANSITFGVYTDSSATSYIRPNVDNAVTLGTGDYAWYQVCTERLYVYTGKIVCKPVYDGTTTYATNVYVGTTGVFSRTTNTSSRTIKHDIRELSNEDIKAERLYNLDIHQFVYNDGIITDTEDARYGATLPGFIIEDMNSVYPIAVDKPSDDVKEWSWNAQYLIPPMLKLIQDQHKEDVRMLNEIEIVKAKLEVVQNKLSVAMMKIAEQADEIERLKTVS